MRAMDSLHIRTCVSICLLVCSRVCCALIACNERAITLRVHASARFHSRSCDKLS